MARRNRKSRQQRSSAANKNTKLTAEDAQQEKSFFLWTGVITAVIVALLYFVFF